MPEWPVGKGLVLGIDEEGLALAIVGVYANVALIGVESIGITGIPEELCMSGMTRGIAMSVLTLRR